MPGLHSPSKLLERRARAIDRRFLRTKSAATESSSVGKDARSAKRSHDGDCWATDHCKQTKLDPLTVNDPWANNDASKIDSIKFDSRVVNDSFLTSQSGVASHVQDVPFRLEFDPWVGACFPKQLPFTDSAKDDADPWANYLKPVQPSVNGAPRMSTLHNSNRESLCASLPPSSSSHESLLQSALALIEAQNSTISRLIGELEHLYYCIGSSQHVTSQCGVPANGDLLQQITQLAASLPSAIDSSLRIKLPEMLRPLVSSSQQELLTQLRDFLKDSLTVLASTLAASTKDEIDSSASVVSQSLTKHVKELLRAYDGIVATRMDSLRDRISQMESMVKDTTLSGVDSASQSSLSALSGQVDICSPTVAVTLTCDSGSRADVTQPPHTLSRISCADFLELSRTAKQNVPFIPEKNGRLLMLCDGEIPSDTESIDSELPSEKDNCLNERV